MSMNSKRTWLWPTGADAIVEELAKRYNPRAQSEEKEKAA
jgi:hypothetical protein